MPKTRLHEGKSRTARGATTRLHYVKSGTARGAKALLHFLKFVQHVLPGPVALCYVPYNMWCQKLFALVKSRTAYGAKNRP